MSKLEELKKMISGLFDNATDKNTIDAAAKLNNLVGEVEKEQDSLTSRNAELLKSYKDVVMHTSVDESAPNNSNATTTAEEDISGAYYDVDAAFSASNLEKFLQAERKK